jgi:hypothetical protein
MLEAQLRHDVRMNKMIGRSMALRQAVLGNCENLADCITLRRVAFVRLSIQLLQLSIQ